MFKLGTPDERVLNENDYIRALFEVDDELVTELNLSSQSWLVPRFPLTVSAGNDAYLIETTNFGRGQYLVTRKDGDPTFHPSVVHFVDEATLMQSYGGGSPAPSGVEFSAVAAALTQLNGAPAIRLAPVPSMTAMYTVVYEPATARPDSKQAEMFLLPQFIGYLTDRATFKLAPYAGLDDTTFKRIMSVLMPEIARGDIRFRIYKQSMWQQDNIRAVPFGYKRWRRPRFF